jgi:hypothetical protein
MSSGGSECGSKSKTGVAVPIFWLVFATVFFSLAGFHFVWSGNRISPFELSTRPYESDTSGIEVDMSILGTGIDQPLEDFIQDLNAHLERENHISLVSHLAVCSGISSRRTHGSVLYASSTLAVLVEDMEGHHEEDRPLSQVAQHTLYGLSAVSMVTPCRALESRPDETSAVLVQLTAH